MTNPAPQIRAPTQGLEALHSLLPAAKNSGTDARPLKSWAPYSRRENSDADAGP